jgi:hypothetical protein
MPPLRLTIALCLPFVLAIARAQINPDATPGVVWIGLQSGSEVEAAMATELRALQRKYDVEPWILTRTILIDENQLPHSHPILTIHTRHIGDPLGLLATFVHEQLHWLEEGPWLESFRAAMTDLEDIFPDVPSAAGGGARDGESTYRHLLVCDLEYQAMTALVGESVARDTLASFPQYTWIYDKVLNDPRIRAIALRHGFDVSEGVPRR